MKTKNIIGIAIAGVLILGSGLYVYYNAVIPKGRAIGKIEIPPIEAPSIDKIFRAADINGDKLAEIILLKKTSSGTNEIYIIDNKGNCLDGWPKEAANPAVGDINNDGYKEIIDIRDNKVCAYDQFGIQINGFPKTVDNNPVTNPALIDLDKDDSLKIMWGSKEPGPCINALSGGGYMMPGWPKEIVTRENADDALKQANAQMPMAVADINNDGKTEVVVFAYNRIYVLAAE